MPKKRRSLTSILVPPFTTQASSSASSPTGRARSHTVSSTSSAGDLTAIDNASDWLSFYSGTTSPISSEFSLGPVTPSRNSPPPDLLDEDPFANLSPAPSLRASRATSPIRSVFDVFGDDVQRPPPTPLSPLAQSALEQDTSDGSHRARSLHASRSLKSLRDLPSTPPPSPIEPTRPRLARRPKSSGPPQVRPAYTRPAFAPRPSLPTLNTLARTSIHVPKRKTGRPPAARAMGRPGPCTRGVVGATFANTRDAILNIPCGTTQTSPASHAEHDQRLADDSGRRRRKCGGRNYAPVRGARHKGASHRERRFWFPAQHGAGG
ncbi:hypothetical protein L226DRAFT_326194 [Lentinus tigrinus ALCF2SS1-7]|uniref:uncharacterized protein n=1 Tax=Lentinus tigrinus ALCF2SS1-7 TaxID=1328758 RepID=UPI00116638FF|nr:hypothetical protein L226DRAFT_326194 [Lentinus tigrinus ALCF2SS1-7]